MKRHSCGVGGAGKQITGKDSSAGLLPESK